ncbi:MAG: DUF2934 domain-containing protein [Verrucomicrobiaceae bacterium]|nr:MAG: DUF2934 domain-containing protein [Verrucomicrobiaceae bacterium]
MSKKKSEKEHKDKKSAGKKAASKVKKAADSVPQEAVVETAPEPVKPKKAKAPAKAAESPKKAPVFSSEEIALRAYFIAERREKMGWPGDSTGDWVEAERQLLAEAKKKN